MCFLDIPPSDKSVEYDADLNNQTDYGSEFQNFIDNLNDVMKKIENFIQQHEIDQASARDIKFSINDELPSFVLSIRCTNYKKEWDNNASCSDDYVERNVIKILYYLSLANSDRGILIARKFCYFENDFWDNYLSSSHSKTSWLKQNMLLNTMFLLYQEYLVRQ